MWFEKTRCRRTIQENAFFLVEDGRQVMKKSKKYIFFRRALMEFFKNFLRNDGKILFLNSLIVIEYLP